MKLVRQFPVQTVAELVDCVVEWEERECALAGLKEDSARVELVQDKAASLLALSGHVPMEAHPEQLVGLLAALFEQGKGVALSTVHKAKGLEAERCYLLRAELYGMAQQRARTAWQVEQEKNVQYVAVTRAQEVLTYC